ncbi:MAG: DEAD/DEAH box helicase [Spirochaetaceae bacterium]|jgi:ATP-dependent Lhr-like helicase|nr:DEAD/DEAH box helicase [Spirochaetaceae bacterium]
MAYSRLAPFLREYIYGQKWSGMRRIQEAAIHEVLDGTGHILIASGTASGKTEAAFFPLLSFLARAGKSSVKPLALCISPLKALINDQYERLEKIIAAEDIGLWRWHGDVAENHKKRFLADPRGILLITPESLEALLLRQARNIRRIFGALAFVVIDEVHIFMGSERGSQLICQLVRIEQHCRASEETRQVRRLGLSATLWDYDGGRAWLSQGTEIPAVLLTEAQEKRRISLAVDYFNGAEAPAACYRTLYEQCRNKRVMIFANSRLEAEQCVSSLRRLAADNGEADIFHIHHGSIASSFRGEAEEKLKSGEGPSVIVATATLELGIDIGDLDRILQIGPPWSVSAFVQRLGRSGRRKGRPEMYFGIMEQGTKQNTDQSMVRRPAQNCGPENEQIPWELLRTIAVIELYLKERWIEPPEEKPLPYSLLAHELLALLASRGEQAPETLCRRLLALPPFARSSITKGDLALLLEHFYGCAYVDKTDEGGLILGTEGEKIVNRHSFYSIFPGEELFQVMYEGRKIGTVNFAPAPGSSITVGGRTWRVKTLDGGGREIRVEEGGKNLRESPRLWGGGGGHIHRRIAGMVKQILSTEEAYAYLSPAAVVALEQGRRRARKAGILTGAVVPGKTGGPAGGFLIIPWLGSLGMRTIDAFLKKPAVQKKLALRSCVWEGDFYFTLATDHDSETFIAALIKETELSGRAGSRALVPETVPLLDKYDYLLPRELTVKQFAANMLDPQALQEFSRELADLETKI